MILKASQRGGGQNLAVHLMRTDDNEHIDLHELRGFASDNLKGAFREAEATAKGTRCRQYLFSLSLSPPAQANVSTQEYRETIDRIENASASKASRVRSSSMKKKAAAMRIACGRASMPKP